VQKYYSHRFARHSIYYESPFIRFTAKILEAYQHKEGSIRQLAQRFKVSTRFVGELLIRFWHTGSYAPKPHGGGNPACIHPSQYDRLYALVQQYPDATLQELCIYLAERCQITASKSSMQRTLLNLQLTRKKDPVCDRTGDRRRSRTTSHLPSKSPRPRGKRSGLFG